MATIQMSEIVEHMVTQAVHNGGRVSCCRAQNSVKRQIPGKMIPYSEKSVLRYICSPAIHGIFSKLGIRNIELRLRHIALGTHSCPCDSPSCSLPFNGFHGVSIVLVPSNANVPVTTN